MKNGGGGGGIEKVNVVCASQQSLGFNRGKERESL